MPLCDVKRNECVTKAILPLTLLCSAFLNADTYKGIPAAVSARIWDYIFVDGADAVVRVAVALMQLHEAAVVQVSCVIHNHHSHMPQSIVHIYLTSFFAIVLESYFSTAAALI